MKKPLIILCVVIVICSLLTVSLLLKLPASPSDGEPQTSAQPTHVSTIKPADPALQQAVKNAITYLKQTQDPTGLLMLNVLYRQFNVAEFDDSLTRYDQVLAANPEPINRVFRRIADYNNSVQPNDFNSVTDQLDRITVPALYSDRMALPDDYLSQLFDAMNSGILYAQQSTKNSGCYILTHALLATIWMQNNHCSLQLPEDFTSTLYQANAALIGDDSQVDDIELEAAAFLFEAGQSNLVSDTFVQNVIAAQFTDGGWSISHDAPGNTNWHPSVLALMILLHVQHPAASYPPMLASAPS